MRKINRLLRSADFRHLEPHGLPSTPPLITRACSKIKHVPVAFLEVPWVLETNGRPLTRLLHNLAEENLNFKP